MRLRCPACRAPLSIPEGYVHRTVRCKYCDEAFCPSDVDGKPPILEAVAAPPPRPAAPPGDSSRATRRSWAPLWLLLPLGLIALIGAGLTVGALVLFVFDGSGSQAVGHLTPLAQTEDRTLPRDTLERLKAMTVFVKVDAGSLQASGSGFLIKTDGDVGYVVTNNHVANPKDDDDRRPLGPRAGAPRFGRSPDAPRLQVVLNSGTAAERTLPAYLVSADSEHDLAILRLRAADLPRPLDLTDHAELTETMPVYILGFPFGERLGLTRNPAVNVGRATVTSIRRDRANKPALVQLEGELHPGNSGGPVVDAHGRLIGVAVAKLEGTQIGFAIAPTVLEDMLRRGR